jgi:uncharacterized membrane protein
MAEINETIVVDRPVRMVYDQWTQFEEFPQFMDGVQSVQQLTDGYLEWVAEIGGQQRSWSAKITEQIPDQVVAWESVDGTENDGAVRFTPEGSDRTRVDLSLTFRPEGMAETIGDKLGIVRRRAQGDLERFKDFVEARWSPTGEWRGRIHEGHVEDRGVTS